MALTKEHIVDSVFSQCGYSKNKSRKLVEAILEIIKSTLENGEDILISGFGKFCVNEKEERKGRNPKTGEDLILGERRIVTFKCSRVLREKMNGVR